MNSLHSESLSLEEYQRYGRQLITPQVGLDGQLSLKNSKVLVVGAGGLGSPALAYLAGAGIGYLGIIDDDIVDISNLHRQVIHSSSNVGRPKVESAKKFIQELNSNVYVECYSERLTNENSFTIFEHYDLILDCTDSPATRYLVNDTAVLLHIPIVSASALKTEGQICVLNYKHGPCYRCLFPIPPPPDSVLSCGDGGIIGPIVGIMGVSQSIEAIKLLTNQYEDFTPYLGIYSAYSFPPWRYIRMRGKKPSCIICGDNPTITKDMIVQGALNYSEFCGKPILVKLDQKYRISAEEFEDMRKRQRLSVLDVREPVQFKICSLPDSKNIPLKSLKYGSASDSLINLTEPVFVVCRYGNDSQEAVKILRDTYNIDAKDLVGGLDAYSLRVDDSFPRY